MPGFSLRKEVDLRFLTFYFNEIYVSGENRYLVSVVDKDSKTHIFQMQKAGAKWILTFPEACPLWIINLENELSMAITEHLLFKYFGPTRK